MKEVYGWAFPDADEFMSNELHMDGSYQASHYRAALQYVTDRRCAIDGGAHVGTWAKLMSADFGQVIAVEPSADTFEALTMNMQRQQCENVVLKHLALAAGLGRVTMCLDGRAATLHNTGGRHVVEGTDVLAEPIDAWNLPALGLLKLDVEGSELSALEGAADTIARCRPIVLFEDKGLCRKHYGLPRDAPQGWLRLHGYRPLQRAGCDEIWGPR